MLKQFIKRHNIVLKKGQNVHILFTLAINYLLMWKLRLYKWMKGIKHPIVHYYAVCWNEEDMLPFMLDYYDQFVEHYTIYDNYSTDRSEEIIRSHKNSEIITFRTDGFDDLVNVEIKNNCWKKSRGKADYVVVCDIDEFVYSEHIQNYIQKIKNQKVTLPKSIGFNMYSETFPEFHPGRLITHIINKGVANAAYSKSILFDPHRIVEINYEPGAHEAYPVGIVRTDKEPYKMLHYKNIDIERVVMRSKINASRLSRDNIRNKYGFAYLYPEGKMRLEFESELNRTEIVSK